MTGHWPVCYILWFFSVLPGHCQTKMNVWVVKFIPMCHNRHEGVNSSSFENCPLLSYFAASNGNFLQTSWDNQSVPSSEVKCCIFCCCFAYISSACFN